ncbi:unnamed protein product, partial [Scytosiphon promiscuus]
SLRRNLASTGLHELRTSPKSRGECSVHDPPGQSPSIDPLCSSAPHQRKSRRCAHLVGDMKHDTTGRAQPRPPLSHEQHHPHGGWETRPEGAGSAISRGTRSPLPGDPSSSAAPRFGGGLPRGTVNVASVSSPAGLQPVAIASNRDSVEPTKEPLPRLQP